MFPVIAMPTATIAAAGVLLAALLLAALLLRTGRLADALQRQRRLSEQTLAAARGEVETLRAVLTEMERALAARAGDMRAALEQRLGDFSLRMAREQGEARVQLEQKLREMADAQAGHMAALHRGVNETLHQAVEQQMQTSFSRVLEQFTAVQKAVGDVQAVAAQIGDLKRIFTNVKTRGAWGEAQLRVLLDDLIPDGYLTNARLRDDSADVVEFAVRLPGRGATKLLPIDAKFPSVDYEKLLAAADAGDAEAERAARR